MRQCLVMVFIQTILLHTALKYRSHDDVTFEHYKSGLPDQFDIFKETNQSQLAEILEKIEDTNDFSSICYLVLDSLFKLVYNNAIILIGVLVELVKEVVRLFDHHYYRPLKFWQWETSIKYWKFLGIFILSLVFVQIIFHKAENLGLVLGTMSFIVESSLPLPQIMLFQRVKSVENFKTILLLSWLGGDFTKISYLIWGTDNVGWIFIIAALGQMSLNLVITYQFFYYKSNPGSNIDQELEMYDLPLRGEPKSGSKNNLYNGNPDDHSAVDMSSRGGSSKSKTGISNYHPQFIGKNQMPVPMIANESIGDADIEEEIDGYLADSQPFVDSDTRSKRASVDLNEGRVEATRSRSNTFK